MNKEELEQLEKLSDFELSAMILKSILSDYNFLSSKDFIHGIVRCKFTTKDNEEFTESFGINNWSDMGPLLKPNNISIAYERGDTPCAMFVDDATEYLNWEFDFQCFNDNELRAAAIVYLLMMERE